MKAEDRRRKSFPGAAGRAAAEWDVARRRTLRHRALRGTLGALGVEVARVDGAEFGVALFEGALSEVARVEDAALEVVAFGVAALHGAALEDSAQCDVAARSDGAALECPAFDVAALVAALEVDGIQVGLWKVAEGKYSDG